MAQNVDSTTIEMPLHIFDCINGHITPWVDIGYQKLEFSLPLKSTMGMFRSKCIVRPTDMEESHTPQGPPGVDNCAYLSCPSFICLMQVLLSRTSPKGCPKHQGHKGDPGVTPGTCGAGGEKAQVILVWVRAPGVGNASHPWRLGVMRERP
jgi:hypothetical protein